jgi:isopentenyl diphosphate isomerase/L-lactate dehydrogenase-like FMN-dependent dehydrogenase
VIDALNFADLRRGARRTLPRAIFEYIDRGTEDESGMAHNRRAFEQKRIAPRILQGASPRSTSTQLFGRTLQIPIVVAPTACAGLVWYKGEIALAKAAAQAGIAFCAATEAITCVEEIAANSPANLWFQLYLWEYQAMSEALVERARQSGAETLVLTVDTPVYANREYNVRNGMGMPFKYSVRNTLDVMCHPHWLAKVLGRYMINGGAPSFANYPQAYRQTILGGGSKQRLEHTPQLTWAHVARLREIWKGNLVLKGIVRADDALRAIDHGVDGVVVSNHGARNLDSAVAPIDALPAIVEAAAGRLTILMDSNIQRGSDIFKALALGAQAVMVGRAFLYGTAMGGEAGALHTARMLRRELDLTMGNSGARNIVDIDGGLMAP